MNDAIPCGRVKDRLVELERRRDELAQQLLAYNAVIGELQALLVDEDGDGDGDEEDS